MRFRIFLILLVYAVVLHSSPALSNDRVVKLATQRQGILLTILGEPIVRYDICDITIVINKASPLGLITNELMSNSLKYAFPEKRSGEINVKMEKIGKELELTIKDDGVGFSDELDWKNTSTLGLKLVRTLVEHQLDGSIDMERKNGTKFIIKFNMET